MATAAIPLPPVRAVTACTRIKRPTVPIHTHFPSVLSNREKVLLRNRIKPPPFGAPVKYFAGGGGGGAVLEIDETKFSEVVLKSERLVLVEFVASWCGPCRLIAPAVQSIAQEYEDKLVVVKVDHDSNPHLIEEYKVYGLPTLLAFQNGEEIPESRREGAITKAKLKDYVDKLLNALRAQ